MYAAPDDVEIVWEQSKYNFDESSGLVSSQVCVEPAPDITLTSNVTVSVTIEGVTATRKFWSNCVCLLVHNCVLLGMDN